MKYLFFVLAILISSPAISQTETTKDCAKETAEAIADFNNGELMGYYDYIRLEFSTDNKFEFFYQTYMYAKYSIYMENHSEGYGRCYPKKMDSLVRLKYGKNLYQKSRREALNIFKNSTREVQSKILDVSKYYPQTESPAKFIGNDYILQDFLKKHFTYKGKEAAGHDFEYRIITLFIDRKGYIANMNSKTDLLNDGFNKKDIIKEMNTLGKFVPAYLIGVPVNAKLHVDLW